MSRPASKKAKNAAVPAKRKEISIDEILRDQIATQRIPPGSKLRESEIADQFGVSRALVREAFSILAQRGLIERIPNRGAIVNRLDYEQVAEIFSVREALEALCARTAALRSQPGDWDEFVELFDGPMVQYLKDGDYEQFQIGYESFRSRIIEAAGNKLLQDMLDSIREKIIFLSRRIIILPGRGEQALREHRALLEALRQGDADQAEALRKTTMRNGWLWFERYKSFLM
ncbi:GntR family transcriptional regulator [Bordetella genomosp. 13]|uniref:GntR family transcriptional regulator n=1 Tax=Bordetella genomosp. 13 TaxID=463040 RepID=UPI00119F6260|nr:GntR family transcriptional regulator [Bordetella genomosp. 13]